MHNWYKILSLSIFFILSQCQSKDTYRYVFQKDLMYTVFDIVIYSNLPKSKVSKYIDSVWNHIENLEFELSPAGDGVVGKLNKEKKFYKQENPQIFSILSNFIVHSKSIHQQSDGAFDLTVYPLIRLWKFYIQDQTQKRSLPNHNDIVIALKKIGMHNIYLDNEKIILNNGSQLDLGAIAKGYAVDEAIKILKKHTNISAGFVNAGGNIRVYGTKPDGKPWRVGIRNPNGDDIKEVISLYDGESIATSGDYEQYFEYDGKYYHHIFDPKTGYPVIHNLSSVSVVLKGDAELTDILATTFLSMGKEKTLNFLPYLNLEQDISLYFIERKSNSLVSSQNEFWEQRR